MSNQTDATLHHVFLQSMSKTLAEGQSNEANTDKEFAQQTEILKTLKSIHTELVLARWERQGTYFKKFQNLCKGAK